MCHGLVRPLGLAIGLPVDGGSDSVVNSNVGVHMNPELAGKLHSVVDDDTVLYTMLADHMLKEQI